MNVRSISLLAYEVKGFSNPVECPLLVCVCATLLSAAALTVLAILRQLSGHAH